MEMKRREYFLETERIGFSRWQEDDTDLAMRLWGDSAVTGYLCASGHFSEEEVLRRLETEIENERRRGIQYWPVFALKTGDLIGCCGLRMRGDGEYELGFHLRPQYWGKGLASEAGRAVIARAFEEYGIAGLRAGHHPQNSASRHVLEKLGFRYTGSLYYEPTGLMHPSYVLEKPAAGRDHRKTAGKCPEDKSAVL